MRIALLLLVLLAIAGCDGASTTQEAAPPAEPESAPADSAAVDSAAVVEQ